MVICDDVKIVYLGYPVKCATRSLTAFFIERFKGVKINTPIKTGHHYRKVPIYCREFTKLAACRNPYDRFVSWWAYWNRREKSKTRFEDFVRLHFTSSSRQMKSQDKQLSQIKYTNGKKLNFGEITMLRIEFLDECLRNLPELGYNKEIKTKIINSSDHEHFSTYYNEDSEKIIFETYRVDFETFGYKRYEGLE